jgi:hypothetical protein
MININKVKENEKEFTQIYGEHHIFDGITDIDVYNKTEPKILWILKEPNDKDGSSFDLRDLHKNVSQYKKWRKTYKLIVKLTYAILNNIDEFEKIPNEYNIKQVLNNIAFINIKKSGGKSRANDKVVRDIYNRDKNIIIEQIKTLDPKIIINCSRVFGLFNDLVTSEVIKRNDFECGKYNDGIIINAYHPNARYSNKLYFNNIIGYIKNGIWANGE